MLNVDIRDSIACLVLASDMRSCLGCACLGLVQPLLHATFFQRVASATVVNVSATERSGLDTTSGDWTLPVNGVVTLMPRERRVSCRSEEASEGFRVRRIVSVAKMAGVKMALLATALYTFSIGASFV
jgi:hypothetical protein